MELQHMSLTFRDVTYRTTNHARRAAVLGVQLPNQRRKEKDVENAREQNPKDQRQHFGIGDTCKSIVKERDKRNEEMIKSENRCARHR